MEKKSKKAQILLITLLVLTIISLVTVGLVLLVNKDIKQVVSNDKYEQSYNVAESQLSKYLDKYATYKISPISSYLPSDNTLGANCLPSEPTATQIQYDCSFPADNSFSQFKLDSKVTIIDTRKIEAFPLKKDSGYDVNLQAGGSSYTGKITVSWDKDAAIDFALVYTDGGGVTQMIRDTYDLNGFVFGNLTGTYAAPDPVIHPFQFKNASLPHEATFVISGIQGFSGTPKTLRITPRMKNAEDAISLTVAPADYSTFPIQIREFTATGFDSKDSTAPVAKIRTKVPLYPQTDGIFDYSLLSLN